MVTQDTSVLNELLKELSVGIDCVNANVFAHVDSAGGSALVKHAVTNSATTMTTNGVQQHFAAMTNILSVTTALLKQPLAAQPETDRVS